MAEEESGAGRALTPPAEPRVLDTAKVSPSIVSQLAALFAGGDHAHGVAWPSGRTNKNGKAEVSYATRHEPITAEAWRRHLDGNEGLVPIPIRRDGTARFGAIDVDVYLLDLTEVVQKVAAAELPLVVCRSKSGGAHLFLFLDEPAPASLVRAKLKDWCVALGFEPKEIFPKQESLGEDEDGNGINAPYFHAEYTTRYAVGEDGKALDLPAFVAHAQEMRVSASELGGIEPAKRFSAADAVNVLVDRYPGQGERQDYVGALVGTLVRWRVDDETISALVRLVVTRAGDEESNMRLEQVPRIRRAIERGHKAPGGPRLKKFIGDENFTLLRRTFNTREPEELDEMNAEYAVAWAGGDVVILREHYDATAKRDVVTFVKDNAPRKYLANRFVHNGEKQVPLFEWWFSHPSRRQYRQVVFEPEADTPHDYNLWRGWAVEPDTRGAAGCGLFLDHLHDVICGGNTWHYAWTLAWLAQAVQQPGKRPGTAIVLNAARAPARASSCSTTRASGASTSCTSRTRPG